MLNRKIGIWQELSNCVLYMRGLIEYFRPLSNESVSPDKYDSLADRQDNLKAIL